MVAKRVVFHVNANKVVQSWCWETENTRDLLSVEEVGGLIPVNPHASKVIAQKVVKRISGKEGQAVWDPICLICRVVEIGFGPSSQVSDRLRALLICS